MPSSGYAAIGLRHQQQQQKNHYPLSKTMKGERISSFAPRNLTLSGGLRLRRRWRRWRRRSRVRRRGYTARATSVETKRNDTQFGWRPGREASSIGYGLVAGPTRIRVGLGPEPVEPISRANWAEMWIERNGIFRPWRPRDEASPPPTPPRFPAKATAAASAFPFLHTACSARKRISAPSSSPCAPAGLMLVPPHLNCAI
jgi:hypothetical protein